MSAYVVNRSHIEYLVEAARSLALSRGCGAGLSWVWNVDHEAGTFDRADIMNHSKTYRERSPISRMLSVRHTSSRSIPDDYPLSNPRSV